MVDAARLCFAAADSRAHADGDSFMGGAHPSAYSVNINVDAARGREATFADLLDKPAADKIFALA